MENGVLSLLLGDAILKTLRGTDDSNFIHILNSVDCSIMRDGTFRL